MSIKENMAFLIKKYMPYLSIGLLLILFICLNGSAKITEKTTFTKIEEKTNSKKSKKSIEELTKNTGSMDSLTEWDANRLAVWTKVEELQKEFPNVNIPTLSWYDWSMKVFYIESRLGDKEHMYNKKSGADGIFQLLPSTEKTLEKYYHIKIPDCLRCEEFKTQVHYYGIYMKYNLDKVVSIKQQRNIKKPIDFYLLVFQPSLVGKPSNTLFASKGSKCYDQNTCYDMNKDGKIFKHEIEKAIMEHF